MTLQVVVGGQYGSEGKGAVAAYLSSLHTRGLTVRVAGPNAGHTVIGRCPPGCQNSAATELPDPGPDFHASDRHPWRLRQVPVTAVSNVSSQLAIAQGSEIDFDVLFDELTQLDAAGYRATDRLLVDRSATVIEPGHKDRESDSYGDGLVHKIGSTGKGIGAARAARAMRQAKTVLDAVTEGRLSHGFSMTDSVARVAREHLAHGGQVMIEGTQGYRLGTHAGFYPQCTSSDCTATDFLAMAGIPPWLAQPGRLEIWVVFRTYPIRVAGNSGPLRGETSWADLGLPPEHTTVTRKVRRVGEWDPHLAREAMAANGHYGPSSPVHAALTMADYVIPELAGLQSPKELPDYKQHAWERLIGYRSRDVGKAIELVGTGPSTMIDIRHRITGLR